jgi:beta-lactamase regulating signal transducer with metallopeptidase domain/predicted  nucleic acid-binding Zn-ribbon protein
MDITGPLLLLVKATLLLGIAFIAVYWERTAPALRRHGVWSTTFIALLVLPLLAVILPAIRVPVPVALTASRSVAREVEFGTSGTKPAPEAVTQRMAGTSQSTVDPSASAPRGRVERAAVSATPLQVLTTLWLGGAVLALLAMARSLYRVRRLAASGSGVADTALNNAADHIARKLGLGSQPSLVLSDKVSSPMAGHLAGPVIFLPADATQWDTERRDIVLAHEMTHLLRRDPFRILAARAACGLYWFHPLMWVAARRFAADCEQACDENVLALGIRPSTYARVLMDFASAPATPAPNIALPIVNRHRLETRLMAILSNADRRPVSARRAALTTLTAAGVIVAIAAAQPAPAGAVTAPTGNTPAIEASTPPPASKPETVTPTSATPRGTGMLASQRGSCWNEASGNRGFSGSSTVSSGRIIQRIGRMGRERVAQMTFGDLRVCMFTDGYEGSELTSPSDWIGEADRVVLETERGNDVRRLEIDDRRTTWTINDRSAAMDDGARAWRSALLDLLDASWEVNMLRGQESSMRGEISSTLGERSSLLGEISSLRGQVSSMLGEISSLRGEESSLRGEISSIRGHESSLRGQISSERGAVSSLESQRWERNADREAIASRIRRHQDAIREIEDEIVRYNADARVREVERRIDAVATDQKVAAVERRIREFDVESKVAAVEREIANLGVERRIRGIEGEIDALNVDTRAVEIDARRDRALDRLRSVLGSR